MFCPLTIFYEDTDYFSALLELLSGNTLRGGTAFGILFF